MNMYFSKIFLVICFFYFGVLQAQQVEMQPSGDDLPQKGFYAGLALGFQSAGLAGTYTAILLDLPTNEQYIDRSYSTVPIHLSFGYGSYFDIDMDSFKGMTFQWAVEGGVQVKVPQIDDQFEKGNFGFLVSNAYDLKLSGIFGVNLGDVAPWGKQNDLLFVQLGLVQTNMEVVANTRPLDVSKSGSVHDWIGFTAGMGYAYRFFEDYTLRTTYTFATYFFGNTYNNEKNDGEKVDYSRVDHEISVGVTYDGIERLIESL